MSLKSRFVLNLQQRSGILLLSVLILSSLAVYYFWEFSPETFKTDPKIAVFQARIDSIKKIKNQAKRPEIHPFNPNFITDYKGYVLGMSVTQIDKLHHFREKNQWINSVSDFKQVTGVSDSLLATISPYFKFPDWVVAQRKKNENKTTRPTFKNKIALNEARVDQLLQVKGLSKELAVRIVNYRRRLGGFLEDNQLYDVYGLKKDLVYKLKDRFTVKAVPQITKIQVNQATASDLATISYITFELAREIVNYRLLHEGIEELDELLKIDGITAYKLDRIKLYLSSSQK